MLISQTVEYALRAVVWLAAHPGAGQTTQQIADGTRVPREYLSKVLQTLSRSGVVQAQRGVGGGFSMLRDPATLTVLDVIVAIDPIQRYGACPLKGTSAEAGLCRLHHLLNNATDAFVTVCADVRIADMVNPAGPPAVPGVPGALCPLAAPRQPARDSRSLEN